MNTALPFRLKDDMVWVEARVNGSQLNGILDSDSDETFLDAEAAEGAAVQKQNSRSGPASSEAEKKLANGIQFDLGSSTLIASSLRILPLRGRFPGMDFILGFDALGRTPFTVDYSKSMVQLGAVPQATKFPFLTGRDVPSVQVSLSNVDIGGVVDTGAPAGLDLPFAWVKSMLPSVQLKQTLERKDLGPRYEALPFLLSEVVIGGVKLSNVKAEAVRLRANPLGGGDEWATIGNQLLSRFSQVGIDGPNRNCFFVR